MGQKEIFSLGTLFQNKVKNAFKNLYVKCISIYQNNLIISSEKL